MGELTFQNHLIDTLCAIKSETFLPAPKLSACRSRCRANMAPTRQSRPDSGLGFLVKFFKTFWMGSSSLGGGGCQAQPLSPKPKAPGPDPELTYPEPPTPRPPASANASAIIPQPSSLNPQPSTRNPQPSTLNPDFTIPNPVPKPQNVPLLLLYHSNA